MCSRPDIGCHPSIELSGCSGNCADIPEIIELKYWSQEFLNGRYLYHGSDHGRPIYINGMHSARVGWHPDRAAWAIMSVDCSHVYYVCRARTPAVDLRWSGHPCVPPDLLWQHEGGTGAPGLLEYHTTVVQPRSVG